MELGVDYAAFQDVCALLNKEGLTYELTHATRDTFRDIWMFRVDGRNIGNVVFSSDGSFSRAFIDIAALVDVLKGI